MQPEKFDATKFRAGSLVIAGMIMGVCLAVLAVVAASFIFPVELRRQDIVIGRHLCEKNDGVARIKIVNYVLPRFVDDAAPRLTYRCANSAQFVNIEVNIREPQSNAGIASTTVLR